MQNWYTPAALNDGAWKVLSWPNDPVVRMAMHMKLQNTAATAFELDVTRDVRLLGGEDFRQLFGDSAAAAIGKSGVKTVAYETANQISNCGPAFSKKKGLVSIWILGMMNAGPQTVILVPYKSGSETRARPGGQVGLLRRRPRRPPESHPGSHALPRRQPVPLEDRHVAAPRRNVLGSIDFQAGVLTLVHFTMPEIPPSMTT